MVSARSSLYALLLSVLVLAVPGCDTDDQEAAVEIVTEQGATFALRGRTLFSTDRSTGAFVIELIPYSDQAGLREGLFLARAEGGALEEGRTYPIVPPDPDGLSGLAFSGALWLNFDGGGGTATLYHSTQQGTLRIDAVTEDRIAGTFSFRAVNTGASGNIDAPQFIEVYGRRFDAERGDTRRFPL